MSTAVQTQYENPGKAKESLADWLGLLNHDASHVRGQVLYSLSRVERTSVEQDGLFGRSLVNSVASARGLSFKRAILEIARGAGWCEDWHYRMVCEALGEPADDTPAITKPEWNADTAELRYKGHTVRRVRRSKNSNIAPILHAFEEEGWPRRIDDPLPGGRRPGRLRDAVESLNRGLASIRFRTDGTGEGIAWDEL